MHKGQLDRESLRAADGVKYFMDTSRRHLINGGQSVFSGDFIGSPEREEETSRWSSGLEFFHCY